MNGVRQIDRLVRTPVTQSSRPPVNVGGRPTFLLPARLRGRRRAVEQLLRPPGFHTKSGPGDIRAELIGGGPRAVILPILAPDWLGLVCLIQVKNYNDEAVSIPCSKGELVLQSMAPSRRVGFAGHMINRARAAIGKLSRLLVVPLLLLACFPRLLMALLAILPVHWPAGERAKRFRLKIGALVLLRHDRPEHAWFWMQRLLESGHRSREAYLLAAVCLYQGLGRLREATALFAGSNAFAAEKAKSLGPASNSFRVLMKFGLATSAIWRR